MTAHSRFLTHMIAIAALMSASGCICSTGGGSGSSGDITVRWTFGNLTCRDVPEVTQVSVQIPGQNLQNNGVYGCNNAGTDGIQLLNFRAGTYSYTVSGQNASGAVIYQTTGKVTVNGDVDITVTLQPTSNATGSVALTWSLPAGTPVTCQYISAVDVSVDMGVAQATTCAAGGTSPGLLLRGLSAGTHIIDVSARDSNNYFYYRSISTIEVVAGGTRAIQVPLQWIVGSVALKWSFNNGITQLNCAQAGVTDMGITLRDATGDSTFTVPCLGNGVQGYQVPYIYYGDYQVFLGATGTGGTVYRSSTTTPPQVTVTAGVFPNVDAQTPTLLLTP